jgi:phospholipase/carboxylesterase
MTPRLLKTVERSTGSPAAGSVIWLHGLGADGHDFEPIVPELALDGLPLRFVFPHAPVRPVTLNGGMRMRAWFDIRSLDRDAVPDEEGIAESVEHVRALLRREHERGVPAERIVLAGFSQGGTIALRAGLLHPERLAGLLALSTFLPRRWTPEGGPDANRKTPVLVAHGTLDPLVPLALGEATRRVLAEHGWPVEWKTYAMPHAVCPQEIADIRGWLGHVYGAAA